MIIFGFVCIFTVHYYAKPPFLVKMARGEARIFVLEGAAQEASLGQKDFRNLKINDSLRAGCEI